MCNLKYLCFITHVALTKYLLDYLNGYSSVGVIQLAPEIPPFNHSSRTHDSSPVLTHCDDLNSDAGIWATTADMACLSKILVLCIQCKGLYVEHSRITEKAGTTIYE